MTVKPKIFYIISFVLLAIVFSLPLQSAMLYQNSLKELPEIFSKISRMNWLMITVLMATAYAVYRVSPLIKILAPLSVLAVAWNNYLTGSYMTDYSHLQTMLATGFFAVLFAPLMQKNVRHLLNNPKNRWWDRSPRRHIMVPVTINPYVGATIQSRTFDISETGAFISFDNQQVETIPKIGERVKLNLNINTLKKIRCEAVVVRVEEPKGIYPRGIGVKFLTFQSDQKRNLSSFLGH